MKREKTMSMTVTEDESVAIYQKMLEKEHELGKRMTLSAFLREYVLRPYLNGDGSPPQETQIEKPKKEEPSFDFDDISF